MYTLVFSSLTLVLLLVTTRDSVSSHSAEAYPKNCYEVLQQGNTESGIYAIQPNGSSESYSVLCNMDSRDGGWTYVLNRYDGSQDFYLNYLDYKTGFGTLEGEFWLGLQHLYELAGEDNELLIEVVDKNDTANYALYDTFRVGSEDEGYAINSVGRYLGNIYDMGLPVNSLSYHLGKKFTTKDLDQDLDETGNCAITYHGAWWYNNCYRCQLTGLYFTDDPLDGITWEAYTNRTLKEARMMIRPKQIV